MHRNVYRLTRTGSLRRLLMTEEDLRPPAANDVTVAVRAIGLNFADVFTILGLYKAAPKHDCIPGIEFSGDIIETGAGVTGFRAGDRVMGSIRFGAYASHLTIDQRYVLPIPDGWSYAEGAAFIVQALTAYYALFPLGNLQKDQTVLIHSAVGGVGLNAHRIAKKVPAYTIGSIGSRDKVALAMEEGYDRVIVRSRDFARDLRNALAGRPLDLVLDAVGGRVQRESFDMLTTTGRLVAYGLSEFASHGASPNYLMLVRRYLTMPRYHTLKLIESNKSILGFNLIWLYDRVDTLREMLCRIQALQLPQPRIGRSFPFEHLIDAVRALQSGETTGKVVVTL